MVWTLFPFKGDFSFGKTQKFCGAKSVRGLSNLGNLMFCQNTLHEIHEWACCRDEAANHQLPIAAAFWIIQIVSTEEWSSLAQNLLQSFCSTHSVILNATTTQYTCSCNGIYHPHWSVQCSHRCSCMCFPVHSLWLPGYLDVMQTVVFILTIAWLFLDRPCIFIYVCICIYVCIWDFS